MTRFIHVGDVHLQAGHPRNADRLQALSQIVEEGLALEQLGAWLIPGDLFHQRSTPEDRNELATTLALMAAKAPVVLVRGNHDQPGDLDIYSRLRATWPVYVAINPGVIDIPLATGEVAVIACLPYPTKAGLAGTGVVPSDTSQTSVDLFDVIFMDFGNALEQCRGGRVIPLFMGHVNVRGSVSSTGQPQIGQELELDRLALARLPAVYCALNHIHKAQEVGYGVYAGSIAAMDHGETEAKSYVVVEAYRHGGTTEWTASWSRRPINTPRMWHIDGTLDREGFHFTDAVALEDLAGGDVRVRYHYKASEKAALSENTIREIFASALRLKIEGVVIPDRDLRAPAVAAARTLPEKLAAYRNVDQLETSVAVKLALLQAADVDGVLAQVAERLMDIEQPERATVAA